MPAELASFALPSAVAFASVSDSALTRTASARGDVEVVRDRGDDARLVVVERDRGRDLDRVAFGRPGLLGLGLARAGVAVVGRLILALVELVVALRVRLLRVVAALVFLTRGARLARRLRLRRADRVQRDRTVDVQAPRGRCLDRVVDERERERGADADAAAARSTLGRRGHGCGLGRRGAQAPGEAQERPGADRRLGRDVGERRSPRRPRSRCRRRRPS